MIGPILLRKIIFAEWQRQKVVAWHRVCRKEEKRRGENVCAYREVFLTFSRVIEGLSPVGRTTYISPRTKHFPRRRCRLKNLFPNRENTAKKHGQNRPRGPRSSPFLHTHPTFSFTSTKQSKWPASLPLSPVPSPPSRRPRSR